MRFLLTALFLFAGVVARAEQTVIRVGHFPNVTHAQGVIAHALSGKGKGWFEERLGPDVKIQWFVYNAGPSAMEAIFADSIDLTYVGPNPAINAHLKSQGEEIRIVAGACSGGAALVVQPDGRIKTDADFKGEESRDAATRQHAGRRGARVAAIERIENHDDGRRRLRHSDGESRPVILVPTRRDRRGVDGRAMGEPAGFGDERAGVPR